MVTTMRHLLAVLLLLTASAEAQTFGSSTVETSNTSLAASSNIFTPACPTLGGGFSVANVVATAANQSIALPSSCPSSSVGLFVTFNLCNGLGGTPPCNGSASGPFSPGLTFGSGYEFPGNTSYAVSSGNGNNVVAAKDIVTCEVMGTTGPWSCGAPQYALSSSCAQAPTFIARTSGENTIALTTLICGLVSDGVITGTLTAGGSNCGAPFDRFYIHAMANSTDGLLDVCGNASAVVHGSPTFTANTGFTGVAASSTVYIDTGFNSNTAGGHYTQNNAHVSIWSLDPTGTGDTSDFVIGAFDGTHQTDIVEGTGTNNACYRVNDNTFACGTITNTKGWFEAERTGASARAYYQNATLLVSDTTASLGLVNANMYTLGFNINGTPSGDSLLIAASTIGASLSSGQKTSFNSRMCTYLTTVHGSC